MQVVQDKALKAICNREQIRQLLRNVETETHIVHIQENKRPKDILDR